MQRTTTQIRDARSRLVPAVVLLADNQRWIIRIPLRRI